MKYLPPRWQVREWVSLVPYIALAYLLLYVGFSGVELSLAQESFVRYFLSVPNSVAYDLFLVSLLITVPYALYRTWEWYLDG